MLAAVTHFNLSGGCRRFVKFLAGYLEGNDNCRTFAVMKRLITMKKLLLKTIFLLLLFPILTVGAKTLQKPFAKGTIIVKPVARNAVRIQYTEGEAQNTLPEWVYVRNDEVTDCYLKVNIDKKRNALSIKDARGKTVFTATRHQLKNTSS